MIVNGMGKIQAEALLAWFVDRPVGTGKGFVAKAMCFPSIQAMDRAICAVDCKPIQGETGLIPDTRAGELARIWEAIDQADSSVIDLLHRAVDGASVIIVESRVHREERVVPVTLAGMGEEEPIRRGGTGAVSHRVEDIGAVAVAFAFQRAQISRERQPGARLEALGGEVHEAQARIASLIAELRAAEAIGPWLEAEVEMWRAKDAEYQRLREQCQWSGVFLLSGR
jgi:hypothetical protein